MGHCVSVCVGESASERVSGVYSPDTPQKQNHPFHVSSCFSLINNNISFLSLSHCVTRTNTVSSPAFISTCQHKPAHENMLFAAVATCTDSQPLTTYTPSVMFYKHFLNNSAHPHLPNGLFFPEGAWLLFASSRLSFCSCLSLFHRLLSPLLLCCTFVVVYSV